jgi:hypothetical protein
MTELTLGWRKSSYSADSGMANCVEVGSAPGTVLVRDTTNRSGATLSMSAIAWSKFISHVK